MPFCRFIKWVPLSLVALSAINDRGMAQSPQFLPLQPHKVQWANAVIKDALKTKDSLQLAEGYYLYGKIYEATGDYLSAKRYFMQSLRIQEKRGDSEELVRLYDRLFYLGFKFYNYADVLRYAHLSLAVAQRIGSHKALVRAYGQMRALYDTDWSQMPGQTTKNLPKPNYDSVLYYLKKIEPLARRSPDPIELAMVNQYLGAELRRRNDPKAISYIEERLQIFVKQKKTGGQVNAMLYLADTYVQFGYRQRAKQLIGQAHQLQRTLPSNVQESVTSFEAVYTHYFQAIGDWKRAFEHQQKVFDLERNRDLADREGAVSRLSVEYETEKKEAQLKSQQKELALTAENLKNQERFLVAMSALFLLALGASTSFYGLFRRNQRLNQQNALLVREQNHRVKNNLQLVSSLLSLQSNRLTDESAKVAVEDSKRRIEVMTALQRKLYDGNELATVVLADFVGEVVEAVLEVFGQQQVDAQYDIDAALKTSDDDALRIGLIINELTTNACKYAFPKHPHPTFRIFCHKQSDMLALRVVDNGPGFQRQDNLRNASFGLHLIHLQVQQLNGTYTFETHEGCVFEMKFNAK